MAISASHYRLLKLLRERGELAVGQPILEIGQANYYMDGDPREWHADIDEFVAEDKRGLLHSRLSLALRPNGGCETYTLARMVYAILFGADETPDAIDFDGFDFKAKRHDLNLPFDGLEQYATVINHGTAEHIFNIAQVFRTIHDAAQVGGLMIHESPFTGWVDHGFYCLQPTLFYDVARANGYEMVLTALEHLPSQSYVEVKSREEIHALAARDQLAYNAMLFVAMRKTAEGEFKIPQQGVYAKSVSESVQQSWKELR